MIGPQQTTSISFRRRQEAVNKHNQHLKKKQFATVANSLLHNKPQCEVAVFSPICYRFGSSKRSRSTGRVVWCSCEGDPSGAILIHHGHEPDIRAQWEIRGGWGPDPPWSWDGLALRSKRISKKLRFVPQKNHNQIFQVLSVFELHSLYHSVLFLVPSELFGVQSFWFSLANSRWTFEEYVLFEPPGQRLFTRPRQLPATTWLGRSLFPLLGRVRACLYSF